MEKNSSIQVILDAIAEHNQQLENPHSLVRATFFIISSHLRENTTIIEKLLQQGHEIGNHGVEDETTVLLTPKKFEQHLLEAHEEQAALIDANNTACPKCGYKLKRNCYNHSQFHTVFIDYKLGIQKHLCEHQINALTTDQADDYPEQSLKMSLSSPRDGLTRESLQLMM